MIDNRENTSTQARDGPFHGSGIALTQSGCATGQLDESVALCHCRKRYDVSALLERAERSLKIRNLQAL